MTKRTIDIKLKKNVNEIYRSSVMIQHCFICNNPLYLKFTSNKKVFLLFAAKLIWSLLTFTFTTCKVSHHVNRHRRELSGRVLYSRPRGFGF